MDLIAILPAVQSTFGSLMFGFIVGVIVCYIVLSRALVRAATEPLKNENRILKQRIIMIQTELADCKLFLATLTKKLKKT